MIQVGKLWNMKINIYISCSQKQYNQIYKMIKDIITTMYKLVDNLVTLVESGKCVLKLLFSSRNIGLGEKPMVVDCVRKEIGGGGVFEGDSAAASGGEEATTATFGSGFVSGNRRRWRRILLRVKTPEDGEFNGEDGDIGDDPGSKYVRRRLQLHRLSERSGHRHRGIPSTTTT